MWMNFSGLSFHNCKDHSHWYCFNPQFTQAGWGPHFMINWIRLLGGCNLYSTTLHKQPFRILLYIRELGYRMPWAKYTVISVGYFICIGQSLFNRVCYLLVYAIREAAAKNLKKLVEKFGADWAQVRKWTVFNFSKFRDRGSYNFMFIWYGAGLKCLMKECLPI